MGGLPRIIGAVVAGLCLALVTACGSGKGSTPTPTNVPTATATAVGAGDELKAVAQNFNNVKSFRAQAHTEIEGQPPQDGTVEVVFPDRVHVIAGGNEFTQIGMDIYVKTSDFWQRVPSGTVPAVKLSDFNDSINNFAQQAGKVSRGPRDMVNGKSCQRYLMEGGSELCVADGLPLQLVSQSGGTKATVVFMDFNAVDVKAPI